MSIFVKRSKPAFEHESCSRCGGSGQHSYCQMYGSTCFKCSGSGFQLTKRGHATQLFYNSLNTKKAGEIQFGDRVKFDGCPGFSKTEVAIIDQIATQINGGSSTVNGVTKTYRHHHIEGYIVGKPQTPENRTGIYTFVDADVKLSPTKEERKERILKALAYQETLTKAGTVRKSKAA